MVSMNELLLEKSGFSNVSTHGDFQDMEYETEALLYEGYCLIEKQSESISSISRESYQVESLEEKIDSWFL